MLNLKLLNKKIILSLLFSVIFTLTLGIASYKTIESNNTKLKKLIRIDQHILIHTENLLALTLQHRRYEKDIFLNITEVETLNSYLDKFTSASKETSKLLDEIKNDYNEYKKLDEANSIIIESKSLHKDYVKNFLKIVSELKLNKSITPSDANLKMKPFKNFIYGFEKNVKLLKEISMKNINEANLSIISNGEKSSFFILIIIIIVTISNFILGVLISNRVLLHVDTLLYRIKGKESALFKLEKINSEMKTLALTDSLTQLANRNLIDQEIQKKFKEQKRFEIKFGLLFMDIDNFKTINDTYGHDVGDKVLQMIANTIIANARPFDLYGRWGGEEFIGIICNINKAELESLANRLRMLISAASILNEKEKLSVTISIGGTLVNKNDTAKSLIKRADTLLYKSKSSGKNCTTIEV